MKASSVKTPNLFFSDIIAVYAIFCSLDTHYSTPLYNCIFYYSTILIDKVKAIYIRKSYLFEHRCRPKETMGGVAI